MASSDTAADQVDEPHNASASSSRSIYSYWGTLAPPPKASTTVPASKRKRTKGDEDGGGQGRLSLGANGASWSLGKPEDGASMSGVSESGSVPGKATKGKKNDGEEAELKAMAKRAKDARKVNGKQSKRTRGGSCELAVDATPSDLGRGSQPTGLSPGKRKRGRPRKSDQAAQQITRPPSAAPSDRDIAATPPFPPPPGFKAQQSSPSDVIITGERILPRDPLTRTASIASTGARADPIDVEGIAARVQIHAGPKKLIFASDSKMGHSFFTKAVGEGDRSRASSVASELGVLDPTPKGTEGQRPAMFHSFFQSNGNGSGQLGQLKSGWGNGVKEGEEWLPPWPGSTLVIHERVADGSLRSSGSIIQRKIRHISADTSGEDFFTSYLKSALREALHDASLPLHQPRQLCQARKTARASVSTDVSRRSRSNRETWCERYRPCKAEEVLGNETEAMYLRDWLKELAVGSVAGRGRKISRKVRRFRPQLFDGWIVDDVGLFGEAAEDEVDDYEEYEEPEYPLGGRPHSYPSNEHRLTNTILLTGPHGCGKSAAVYAAATELDWEVFEVYPGMGKRTGASLMSWVGDVGKNHMVVKGAANNISLDKVGAIDGFFGKAATKPIKGPVEVGSQGSAELPIDLNIEDNLPSNPPSDLHDMNGHGQDGDHRIRQSLILIDEADILYAEEPTFWPAIVSLIADSRRPVVLTCNDPTLIPSDQLPLQAMLHFRPPPPDLAIPYLRSIAEQESVVHNSQSVAALYQQSIHRQPDLIHQPLVPNGNEWLPYFDLRRAIQQLQLDRQLTAEGALRPEQARAPLSLARLSQALDVISFVDAIVSSRPSTLMEVCDVDYSNAGADDQSGISALLKPRPRDSRPVLAGYDHTDRIAATLLDLTRPAPLTTGDLQIDRTQYVRSLLPILDPLIPLNAYLLPHPSLFLDYLPTIQQIVEIDDVLEAEEEAKLTEGGSRLNRKTGRPKRAAAMSAAQGMLAKGGFERYLDIGRDGLEVARTLGFEMQ